MITAIIGAFILGLIVWGLGSLFDATPGHVRARNAGFITFVVVTALVIAGHYGAL